MKDFFKKKTLQLLDHSIVAVFAIGLLSLYTLIIFNLSFLNPISKAIEEFSMTDEYFQMLPEKDCHNITIVDLSPLESRSEIAMAVEQIESCNPTVIGLDCVFRQKKDTIGDEMLREVASQYDNIVFAVMLSDEHNNASGYNVASRSFFADELPIHEGITNMPRNLYGGIKRKLRLGWNVLGEKKLSVVGEVVNTYVGKELVNVDMEDLDINFSPTRFDVIKPAEILQNRDKIEGRIVMFGTMTDETDMHYTPLGKIPGIILLAYSVQTILEHSEIIHLPFVINLIITLLIVVFTDILLSRYKKMAKRLKYKALKHFVISPYIINFFIFVWIALLLWFSFIVFCFNNIALNIGWAIAAIAFIASAHLVRYDIIYYYDLLKQKRRKIINKNISHNEKKGN